MIDWKGLTVEDLLECMPTATPRMMWKNDNWRAREEDRAKKRGNVVLSPDVAGVKIEVLGWPVDFAVTGDILTRDGKEYRVHVEEYLRGRVDRKGNPVNGYWIEHLDQPKLSPIIPMPDFLRRSKV